MQRRTTKFNITGHPRYIGGTYVHIAEWPNMLDSFGLDFLSTFVSRQNWKETIHRPFRWVRTPTDKKPAFPAVVLTGRNLVLPVGVLTDRNLVLLVAVPTDRTTNN